MRILLVVCGVSSSAITGPGHRAAVRRRSGAAGVRRPARHPPQRLGRGARSRHAIATASTIASACRSRGPTPPSAARKLPIILVASPYSGGTRPYPQHDINVPLFVPGSRRPRRAGRGAAGSPSRTPSYGNEPPIRDIAASGYQAYFLPRGFIFADANSLGTGHSTGCPTIGGVEENLAMKAVIDWFNGKGQAFDVDGKAVTAYWTTGATAMIGTSYVGTLPIGAASLGVEGLKAIVPIAGVSSYYDHRRSYGTVINSFPMIGTDADTLFDNILSRQHPEACACMRARIAARGRIGRRATTTRSGTSATTSRTPRKFKAAVLISHGLNDFNVKPRHAARLWEALKTHKIPAKIWWNQGGHGDRANTRAPGGVARHAQPFLEPLSVRRQQRRDGWSASGRRAREQRRGSSTPDWPVPGAAADRRALRTGRERQRHRPARRRRASGDRHGRDDRGRRVHRRQRARRCRAVAASAGLSEPRR